MTIRHKLIITAHKVETLCKIRAVAFYPQTDKIMNEDNAILHTTFDDDKVNCIACEKQLAKENSNGTAKKANADNGSHRTESN